MNNLTTEQLARIFGERIGQEIIYNDQIQIIRGIIYVKPMNLRISLGYDAFENLDLVEPSDCKLLLTPLENIIDEDLKALAKIRGFAVEFEFKIKWQQKDLMGYYVYQEKKFIKFIGYSDFTYSETEYLKHRGYDIPMFFGIDHPDNGKTLISMGIALDKTTLNK